MFQSTNLQEFDNNLDVQIVAPAKTVNETPQNHNSLLSLRTKININSNEQINLLNDNIMTTCDTLLKTSELTDSSSLILERNNPPEPSEIDESNVNFNLNKEQWQRRASSQNNISSNLVKQNRHSEPQLQWQSHTPDLVMDLPLVGNCSPQETKKKSIVGSTNLSTTDILDDHLTIKTNETSTDPDSPEMTTAAETFAKQNQCTLKKNTKLSDTTLYSDSNIVNTITSSFKPQLKTKPPLLKKPVLTVNLNASVRKDQDEFPT